LAGDFISQRVVTQLHGESLSYADPHPTTVCSGLDSTCYSSMLLLDVGVHFLTGDNLKHTIFVTVSINPSTSIDLILGRHTLKKFDFFALTPRALWMPQLPSARPIIVAPPPTPPGAMMPEAHRRHPGSAPNFCSRHNGTGVAHQPCARFTNPPAVSRLQ
jgi:hypothetical protein